MNSVAITGRPNVGKSALFNRLAGRKISIVHDQPGVTRDRITATCRLGSAPFEIVDTGGIGAEPDPGFSRQTHDAAAVAIEGSNALLLVVDAQTGEMPLDRDLAARLRESGRPVILVVNKVDVEKHEGASAEFAGLGFAQVVEVSAAHGRGTSALVEAIESVLPPAELVEASGEAPRLAIVGRPNAGKSSILNAIVKSPRAIVSDIPGTTRDAFDTSFERDGRRYVLCDTAGIRHRSRHNTSVEVFSVMRSEASIERADLCLLVIDAATGVTAQDKRIGGLIQRAGKAAVIVLNKWDLVSEQGRERSELLQERIARVREELFFLTYAPVVAASATTGSGMRRIFGMVESVRQHAAQRVGTGELNRLLRAAMNRQPPPMRGNRRYKLLYATQVAPEVRAPFQPPAFLLFGNDPRLLADNYFNYLSARLREKWEFAGLPIFFRQRGRLRADRPGSSATERRSPRRPRRN